MASWAGSPHSVPSADQIFNGAQHHGALRHVSELTPRRRHRFVAAEAAVALFRTAPGVDYRQFRADLDAVADQSLTPRG